ncbi:MAG: GNAT family N-acetyltransferase [Myxococcales bacterium]|nr:GNAT family N-acetyltransferase [Myxococcales bacterium]
MDKPSRFSPELRRAGADDLAALTAIYNHYIECSPATFDLQPFEPEQRRPWLEGYSRHGPYQLWVAESKGRVLGYACSGPFRPKAAYGQTVETSIYLAPEACGQGLGSRLYERLFGELEGAGVHVAVVAITVPNEASVALHRRVGFEQVGVMREVGYKLGRYWDVMWMQRGL